MNTVTRIATPWFALAWALLLPSGLLAQTPVDPPVPQSDRASLEPTSISDARSDLPISIKQTVLPIDRVASIRVASVDVAAAFQEDDERESRGLPPHFAVARPVTVTPQTGGTWEMVDSDFALWRVRVGAEGARSLNFGFTRYHMPVGGRMLLFSADLVQKLRPFTDADNKPHRQLWTPPIEADEVVIEVLVHVSDMPLLDIELGSVNVGYRLFGEAAASPSGACNVDVACSEGQDWQEQVRAVGLITIVGVSSCSGVMLNNTAEDFQPLFLTANHCGVTFQNAPTVIVYWNFQNSTCRTPGSPESGGLGDGRTDQFQTGTTLLAEWAPADLTLLQLNEAPASAWRVNFAGWDRSGIDPAEAVCVHHPRTGEKRISFELEPATTTSYQGLVSPGDGTSFRITDWDLGTTERGSSGSPLFDPAHRVVGFLKGGLAACGNDDSDWFTRLAAAWDSGSSSATRLRDWLDPLQTNAVTVDFISGVTLSVAPAGGTEHIGRVGGPFSNPQVAYTLRNPTDAPVIYHVHTDQGLLLLNGSPVPVQGVVPPNGGTVDLTVTLPASLANLAAGTYEDVIRVDDLTHTQTKSRRHSVEIGLTYFDTAPTDAYLWGGPIGGPFDGSIVYTLGNDRPTPVVVEVSSSVPWISLNEAPGPLTFTLDGMGSLDAVAVGFSADAEDLPEGTYTGTVTFRNLSGGGGDTTRSITLEVGRVVFTSVDTPIVIADRGEVTSFIDVPQGFCIADLNVELDLRHTYVGDLIVSLLSPGGTIIRLHNRSGAGRNDLVLTYDSDGDGVAPDGPGNLSDFDLESTVGRWTLSVVDRVTKDTGVLNRWRLLVTPQAGSCPVPNLIYRWDFNSDPGWSTQGLWAFGPPRGFGSFNGDPISGVTGSNVYGYNLFGDYQGDLAFPQQLTTSAIDCSQITSTRLRFYRWLGVEESQYDKATVQVSANGVSWTTIWAHTSTEPIMDSEWVLQTFNISDIADGQSSVFVRWGMGPTDRTTAFPGWNVDDVEILGLAPFDDCNRNGLPDENDVIAGRSQDCNRNDLPDECDIEAGGSDDCNRDGMPDECDCTPLRALFPEPDGVMKSRYLSFVPPAVPCPVALRVRLVRSTAFSEYAGDWYWVGPPVVVNETGAPAGRFTAAPLQCKPFVTDWSAIHLLHVYGAGVVPETEYEVRALRAGCLAGAPPATGDGFSPPLFLATAKWGDAVAPFGGPFQPTFTDVSAMVDRFQGVGTAPIRPSLQLRPDVPNPASPISFLDMASELDAFKGVRYPFPIPDGCP